jgi:hypothetical protein
MSALIGHGVGLRPPHFPHLLAEGPTGVSWLEVTSENFFEPGGRPWAVLEKVRRDVPVALHGVSLAIGNAGPLSEGYLRSLEKLIQRVQPSMVSDHLCWGGARGRSAHDLLPLPYTEEVVSHVSRKVAQVQERLGRQLLLENVSSYVAFESSEMTEWECLLEIARRSGCGLLFDVNNVYVSARNHGFSAEAFIDAIPGSLVGYVHLAGHTDHGTWVLDSHVGPVPEPVWSLYRRLIARTGPLPTLVEWDDQIPPWETVVAEAQRAAQAEREVLRAA